MPGDVVASVDAASWHDPLGRLRGHIGVDVEVMVVVQDDELLDVRDGRQGQVGDAGPTVLATTDELRLQIAGRYSARSGFATGSR